MSRESFGEKLDRGTEPILEDIDKVPLPEFYPEPMPDEEPEKNPNFDINPEEGLINEEENKGQEDEIEETYKKKPGDKTPIPEKKLDNLEINKKIIDIQSKINAINKALEIEIDEGKIKMFQEHLRGLEAEKNKLLETR